MPLLKKYKMLIILRGVFLKSKFLLIVVMSISFTALFNSSVFAAKKMVAHKKVTTESVKQKEEKITKSEVNAEELTETATEVTTEIATEIITEATTLSEVDALVAAAPVYAPKPFDPIKNKDFSENGSVIKSTQTYDFENGDRFLLDRFEFKTTTNLNYDYEFFIEGNEISIRYVDPETKVWVNTTNVENIKHNTLFITTDMGSAVVSVPAVYKNVFTNNTLEIMRELETPIKIEKWQGKYKIKTSFPVRSDCIGEIWALTSKSQLIDWSKQSSFDNLLNHDLGIERRWSWDGYYFKIPSNYVPSGENMLYRNPANYTGALCVKLNDSLFTKDMGYIMTYVCMQNQNDDGFWATGPKSLWLEEDFAIGENFYDTRFNTDFATSLLRAYQNFNNKDFLKNAVIYGNYLIKHAENNHYKTINGGWLVEDYAENGLYNRTHVSLNHHLAELNFLYELYNITKKEEYKTVADTMLKGVEDTKEQWVLEDGNLKYALMYEGTANTMVDYPYLTYNDLLYTKQLLIKYFNKTSETVEYLMRSKLGYMIANNITGYNIDN